MATIQFSANDATYTRLQAYAADHKMTVEDALLALVSAGLNQHESEGKYAQLFNNGELRQALTAYYD